MNAPLEDEGFAVSPVMVDSRDIGALIDALAVPDGGAAVRAKNARVYAVRNLLATVPAVRRLADAPAVRRVVAAVLGPGARPVRAILFDKTPGANWKVAWHQDLSIAVRERRAVKGFGPWSVKAGVVHVQPPAEVLARMLTLRLHLDDCGPTNGPLRVLPGSHRGGALSPTEVHGWRARTVPVACCAPAGAAVLMRPLLLHASSAATDPGHRRVVHIEWSADPLPGGLAWDER